MTRSITAVGIFLLFGALMASLAGTTLVWRGTPLEGIWRLNPRAWRELAPFGRLVGIPFLLLGFTMAITAVGWFRRRLWAWRLAVAILVAQVVGDVVNIFLGRVLEGAVGVTIAGALVWYLLRRPMRESFGR